MITDDVLHTPLQVTRRELTANAFDADSAYATETRRRFLDEHEETDCLLHRTRFAPPTAGYVRGLGGQRRLGSATDA